MFAASVLTQYTGRRGLVGVCNQIIGPYTLPIAYEVARDFAEHGCSCDVLDADTGEVLDTIEPDT